MGRDPEAVKRKRQKEKERRQKKSDLTDEHLEFMRQKLDEHDGEENIFAKVAHKMKDEFDLDCSHDWLRGKVQSKFEEWSGIGAKRRKETAKREEVEVIDVDVAEAFEVMDHAKADLDAEKRWQKDLENLFLHKRAPPILGFVIDHQRPAEVQEIFRNKMLEYWSKNAASLRYSESVEPMNQGALNVLRFYAGHRDSRGRTITGGETSIHNELDGV